MHMTNALRNLLADAFGNAWDGAVAEFRSGSKPATSNLPPTGTIGASVSLPADAMANAVAGVASKTGTWEDASTDAAVTLGWCRFRLTTDTGTDTQSEVRCDFTVGATGSGAEIEVDNPVLAVGQQFTVTGFNWTQPAS